MKKNVLNIFLSVAITIMTILCYKCFVGLCSPIRLETRYTLYEYGAKTYIFHSDRSFDEILVRNGKEEKAGYGMYSVDGDTIHICFVTSSTWQPEQHTMKIEDNGACLRNESAVYRSDSHVMAFYTILAVLSEIVLIIIAFRVNDLERNALLELEREWPYMTEEEKEQHRQKFTAEYDEKTRRITAKYNDRMNKLNLSFTDTMSEEEKEQQRQSLTADYNDQMGRLTVKYRNTMNKLQ